MMDFLTLMSLPLAACLILTGIHAYLGIHVIERGVIFVDLALAQIAALGMVVGCLFGYHLEDDSLNYWFALAATLLGALLFSVTRTEKLKVPQEAIIGIIYAVAAAAAMLVLAQTAEGDEHLRHMLVGNILLVTPGNVLKMLGLYFLIGVFHWLCRDKFILISTNSKEARKQALPIKKWDFLFYGTFGVVVTSSVQVAGVLLVFSFLIIPAVAAVMFCESFRGRLFFGWFIGSIASFLGMFLSYFYDLPTGATTVCTFGGVLVLLALIRKIY